MNAEAMPAETPASTLADFETENDRFKRSFSSWFWGSMIAATVVHFMLFQFWPTLTAEDVSFTVEELETIELPRRRSRFRRRPSRSHVRRRR